MKKVIKHMKVVLIQNVANVGEAGQIKDVRPGFARNFLLPKKLVVLQNDPIAQELFKKKSQEKEEEIVKQNKQNKILEKVSKKSFTFKVKADNKGKLYGSVGPKEISKKTGLGEQLFKVHYKELGKFRLPVTIAGKKAEILIEIQKE